MNSAACVITTIQEPTDAVHILQLRLAQNNIPLIIIGDKKGPSRFDLPNTKFLTLEQQLRSGFALAKLLPTGHYARKNLGYLEALKDQTLNAIYDTDDDNFPDLGTWSPKDVRCQAHLLRQDGWFNIYRSFSDRRIWPRGFPLSRNRDRGSFTLEAPATLVSPIQQLLCDDAPDVDAVWRLAIGDEPFSFDLGKRQSIYLAPGTWCPFNSQATWWFREAFPLLYLPSTCTFRMTDIWRSFVAQRCLWELDMGVTFHPPQVIQQRNPHDLMKDFEDEIPGYLQNEKIARILSALSLKPHPSAMVDNLIRCYEALIAAGIFKTDELPLLRAWVDDISPLLCLPSV
jgi:hypothetical protein